MIRWEIVKNKHIYKISNKIKHTYISKTFKTKKGQMKIKKSNNISIFMTKDDANSGSEDKA